MAKLMDGYKEERQSQGGPTTLSERRHQKQKLSLGSSRWRFCYLPAVLVTWEPLRDIPNPNHRGQQQQKPYHVRGWNSRDLPTEYGKKTDKHYQPHYSTLVRRFRWETVTKEEPADIGKENTNYFHIVCVHQENVQDSITDFQKLFMFKITMFEYNLFLLLPAIVGYLPL